MRFCDTGTLCSTSVSIQGHSQVSFGPTFGALWPPWNRFKPFGVPSLPLSTFCGSLWLLREGSGFPWASIWGLFGVTLGALSGHFGRFGATWVARGSQSAPKDAEKQKTRVFVCFCVFMPNVSDLMCFCVFSEGHKEAAKSVIAKTHVFLCVSVLSGTFEALSRPK